MILLLELNPLSRPVAITEILLLVAFAAFVGWVLARLILRGRIISLREAITQRSLELEECNSRVTSFTTTEFSTLTAIEVEDDLKVVEGIGPKIEALLKSKGIATFSRLASTSEESILKILHDAGPRFQMHDPATWRQQATLAHNGKWEELEELQNRLTGGRE